MFVNFFSLKIFFLNLFLAALGLRCYSGFLSCSKLETLVMVSELLMAEFSLVSEHRFSSGRALGAAIHGLMGSRMWVRELWCTGFIAVFTP